MQILASMRDETRPPALGISIKGLFLFGILQYLFLDAKWDGRIEWNWFYVLLPAIIWAALLVYSAIVTFSKAGWRNIRFRLIWN